MQEYIPVSLGKAESSYVVGSRPPISFQVGQLGLGGRACALPALPTRPWAKPLQLAFVTRPASPHPPPLLWSERWPRHDTAGLGRPGQCIAGRRRRQLHGQPLVGGPGMMAGSRPRLWPPPSLLLPLPISSSSSSLPLSTRLSALAIPTSCPSNHPCQHHARSFKGPMVCPWTKASSVRACCQQAWMGGQLEMEPSALHVSSIVHHMPSTRGGSLWNGRQLLRLRIVSPGAHQHRQRNWQDGPGK